MITISGYWVLVLIGYGALATGIALAAIAYASKHGKTELQDEAITEIGDQAEHLDEAITEELKGRLRYMAGEYVRIQNEYAWFRNMVRQADPASYLAAVRSIEIQKKQAEEKRRVG